MAFLVFGTGKDTATFFLLRLIILLEFQFETNNNKGC